MSRPSLPELLDVPVQAGVDRRGSELTEPEGAEAAPGARERREPESRRARWGRQAHRTRLYVYAFVAVAVLIYMVALAVSNTHHVKINWVFGSSSVSLVWLVLFAAILGALLGILLTGFLRWRTRAPRPS